MKHPNNIEQIPEFSKKQKTSNLSNTHSWTQEELDIIEMIIYDVQMRKEYYEDNNAPTCVKECEQELKFLEQLKEK